MAIDKKLIFWKKQSTFNAPSSTTDTTGSVMWYSIVFFKDTGQIWTNGTYYNCGIWGTPQTNYVPLTIGGVTVNLSKDGHTHSYLPSTGGAITGNTTIKGGTDVFEYTLRLAKGNYADTGGHTTLIGFGAETVGWSKSAIGHTRTGSYDRGYLGFYINNSIDTTSATASDLKMSINSSGLVWSNGGFSKQGSSDSYVLLGAGGHKLLSDFTSSLFSEQVTVAQTDDTWVKGYVAGKKQALVYNTSGVEWGYLFNFNTSANYGAVLATSYSNNTLKMLTRNGGTWGGWVTFHHSENSNLTSIDWSAKNLTLNGTLTGASVVYSNRFTTTNNGVLNYIYTTSPTGNAALTIEGANYTHAIHFKDGYNTSDYALLSGGYTTTGQLLLNKFSAQNTISNTSTYRADGATIEGNIISNSFVKSGGTASQFLKADGSSDATTYLSLAGGTMTGPLNFKNGTWNNVGDDAAIGDINVAGQIGIKSLNTTNPGIAFYNSSNTAVGNLVSNAGTLQWSNNTVLHTGNYSSYALPLSGGVMTGPIIKSNEILNLAQYHIGTGTVTGMIDIVLPNTNWMGDLYISIQDYVTGKGGVLRCQIYTYYGNSTGFAGANSVSWTGGTPTFSQVRYVTVGSDNNAVRHILIGTSSTQWNYSSIWLSKAVQNPSFASWSTSVLPTVSFLTADPTIFVTSLNVTDFYTYKADLANSATNATNASNSDTVDLLHASSFMRSDTDTSTTGANLMVGSTSVANPTISIGSGSSTGTISLKFRSTGLEGWLEYVQNSGLLSFKNSSGGFIGIQANYLTLGGALSGATTGSFSSHVKIGGGTANLSSPWDGGLIAGNDGHDKIVATYLASNTNSATIGAHNSLLNAWAKLNVAGTSIQFSINETPKMILDSGGNLGLSGQFTASSAIISNSSALGASTPFAITNSRIQSYASVWICADTDNSTGEGVFISASKGVSTNPNDGLAIYNNTVNFLGNTVWHAGNDGHNSGLDADTVDGVQLSTIRQSNIYHLGNYYGEGTTVANCKQWIVDRFNSAASNGIGANVTISQSYIGQWDNNAGTYYPSSVYSMIKIGGGYENMTYGQFLLSSYDLTNIGVVGRNGNAWSSIKWLAFTTDNVASATKLANTRTIWGQNFNGEGNVSGSINNVIDIIADTYSIHNSTTNPYLKLTLNGLNWYIQAHQDRLYYGYGASNSLNIDSSGNVGIGTTSSSSYKLDINGTGRFTGNVTAPTFIGNLNGNAATATYAENSSKLYSIDTTYKYGGGYPYYGYLSYTGSRWRFQMSPATPAAIEVAYADVSGSTVSAQYLPTKYDGGVKTNPQDYFSNTIGLRVAMTGAAGTWTDTLWINGYAGGDVLSMCALHTSRQGTPKMWISNQNSNATTYGTLYEFITTYNVSSHALPIAGGTLTGALTVDLGAAAASPLALKSSGVTTTMGSLNGSWFHMGTTATSGFYFYQNVQSAGTMTATSFIGNASTATRIAASVSGTNTIELVRGNMADNDQFRILVGGTDTNAGYVEIATADDGTEPIYVRQYLGVFTSLVRTATLLNEAGNTIFPGSVTGSRFYTGYDSGVANSVSCSNWFRSSGATGWYNESYGGGINMENSDAVNIFGNKILYNQGYRVWGIGGHRTGIKLYDSYHIGINLATDAYTWGIYANSNGNMYFGRRSGNINDESGTYYLTLRDTSLTYAGEIISNTHLTTTGAANATGHFGSVSSTWGNTGGYPTLFSNAADRWIMHINPHISYVQNGVGGYTGSMVGSTIRFASDTAASTYWDLGVGVNGVGADKFSVGRSGSSFVSISNTGNMTLNGYLQVQGGDDVVGIKSSYYGNNIGMYFGNKLQYQSTSGIKEFIMTTRLYNINPTIPSYAQYNKVPVILWHGRITITSSSVIALTYNYGAISLTGTRLGTGTARLDMVAQYGAALPTDSSNYIVVGCGLGAANTTGSCAYFTIPDTYKYWNNFRIVISDDSTANDGYAEIMIIKVMDPTYYAS